MSYATVSICETENEVLLDAADERVELNYNEWHGDWNIVHERAYGDVHLPGAVYHRTDAIVYGLYLLGALEDTDIRPVESR